ncbi:MAG: RsmE family RNA methyltransferase [Chitinophagales bacterium]
MQRYFTQNWSLHEPFLLSEEESRHCISVMRNTAGNQLTVLDGVGNLILAKIIDPHPKRTTLQYLETIRTNPTRHNLHIAISPTKSNDRIEWFLEKACEIGVGKITPILFERTERSKINLDRWNKIIVASCKQSSLLHFPILAEPKKFLEFITPINSNQKLIVCAIGASSCLSKIDSSKENILIIGPEGDFTPEELNQIKSKNAEEISISENILRVETAGIVGATLWNRFND